MPCAGLKIAANSLDLGANPDEQDTIANQQAGRRLAHDDTVVLNSDRLPLQDRLPGRTQFIGQVILKNLRSETGTKPIHNRECAADDDPRI